MKLNTTEKIIAIVIIMVVMSFGIDYLNYKSWVTFGAGIVILTICVFLLVKIFKSFIKIKKP